MRATFAAMPDGRVYRSCKKHLLFCGPVHALQQPRPPRAPPPASSQSGLIRAEQQRSGAAAVISRARPADVAGRAITKPPAMTSADRHRRETAAHDALPGRVAKPVPEAEGGKATNARAARRSRTRSRRRRQSADLPADKAHHQDHVRPRDRLHDREEIGEVAVGQPAILDDDKMAQIRQHRRDAAKADQRQAEQVDQQRARPLRCSSGMSAFDAGNRDADRGERQHYGDQRQLEPG